MHIPSAGVAPSKPLPFYRHLYFQVIVAIIIGVLVGYFDPKLGEALKPLGDAFVKLVKMIIAPGDLPDHRHRHRRHDPPAQRGPGLRQGDDRTSCSSPRWR